ncbi:hypothetical protein NQ317_010443 [Molorchus minor]|uniref:Peptidase aspartic putative domain-containing protein n=1 Tax=Molorchus minor TaxID=1323400 RepID=A0ABQ9JZQ4_9CUCU|nr:hypothetical protein NQ317_010443 [Molorchus minor]
MADLENLEALKRKRSTLKGQLTRFQTYLGKVDSSNPDFVQIEARLVKSEALLEEFNSTQFDIEVLDKETTQADHDNERDNFEQNYYSIISKAKAILALFNLSGLTKESYIKMRAMLDNVSKHLRALEVLGEPVAQWDTLLIYLVTSKLDPSTRRDWEEKNENDLTPKDRFSESKRLGLCVNCLRKNHSTKDCKAGTCRKCNKRHHTLLHILSENSSDSNSGSENQEIQANHSSSNDNSYTLLSTAIVQVFDKCGKLHDCRVLLDSGSMSSFITKRFCEKIQVSIKNANFTISGINQARITTSKMTDIKIQSKHNSFQTSVRCLVLPKITERLPCFSFSRESLDIPKNIALADDKFDSPSQVDILLGADVFWDLLMVGQIKLGKK